MPRFKEHGCVASLNVPLRTDCGNLGVLEVDHTAPRGFSGRPQTAPAVNPPEPEPMMIASKSGTMQASAPTDQRMLECRISSTAESACHAAKDGQIDDKINGSVRHKCSLIDTETR